MERIVSVWPEADLLSVYKYLRLAHGSVKIQDVSASVELFRADFKGTSVCSFAHVRKSSCAACLFCRYGLSVLLHGHGLKVVGFVEWAVNRPVVRDGNGLPAICGLDFMTFSEFPFLQESLRALTLCQSCCGCCQYSQYCQYLSHWCYVIMSF